MVQEVLVDLVEDEIDLADKRRPLLEPLGERPRGLARGVAEHVLDGLAHRLGDPLDRVLVAPPA